MPSKAPQSLLPVLLAMKMAGSKKLSEQFSVFLQERFLVFLMELSKAADTQPALVGTNHSALSLSL